MLKQYIKMAIQMLRENPLISSISILGTALSIAMIMVVVLIYQIQLAGYSPESNRGRMLYVYGTEVVSKDGNQRNRGGMAYEVVKDYFYALQAPEAVTATQADRRPISLPGKRLFKEYALKFTDDSFWKIFDLSFIEGKPFTEADFQSGIRVAVVSDALARELFESTQVVGKTIVYDFMEYTICGVVREVSKQANDAYADIWIPYTSQDHLLTTRFGKGGYFNVCVLAKERKDFEAIRGELEKRSKQLNDADEQVTVSFPSGMLSRLDIAIGSNGFQRKEMKDFLTQTGAILLFLLLVPALNLTGVTQSAVQRRRSEVGVRKAFGATGRHLLTQIIGENCVTTLLGGVIGFALSFVFLHLCKNFLLSNEALLNAEMLFQPVTFAIALVFVLLLNLLSSLIPAMRTARQPIVESLKDVE